MNEITNLTQKLKIKYPIIQAPMAGGATTPELVAAVSNYGGLGSLGAGYMQPEEIRAAIKQICKLTDKPFAVNLFIPQKARATSLQIKNMRDILKKVCPKFDINDTEKLTPYAPDYNEQLQVIIDEKVPVFSFTFGMLLPEEVEYLKSKRITLIGTATSALEAWILEDVGIDIIVAQGIEAGGHRGAFLGREGLVGLLALIPQIISKVKIPVIAAGGIMNRQGIDAALLLGASGVAMGTAFLTTHECGIHPKYKKTLLKSEFDFTCLTKAFSGKLARGICNDFTKRMEKFEDQILEYPIQNKLTQHIRKQAALKNDIEFMSLWAGQGVHLCKEQSATALMQELCKNL
ncbi:MAG: nitropropane dioxygenase/trans-enoyl-CoA reductase [Burkholderiales bacterium]|jgi:nitronate monooxygenase|nr:nitropropane dioxygenase/trans-enoyl-CoA reductase [Burkholderiales bacterium]